MSEETGFPAAAPPLPDLYEAPLQELQHGLQARQFTSAQLVQAYLARIDEVNMRGPVLRAVIETNPGALQRAREIDAERDQSEKPKGLLYGIPVLLKDNIATLYEEGMNTTAGSFSLLGSVVPDDAGVVKRLREAGAIILGKTNLSEFGYFRGNVPSGWSARGGQTTGAYAPHANPCGSSSGSGVAVSIGLAPVALGTETDGSISCPAAHNNVVGVKPTLGLTSRAGGEHHYGLSFGRDAEARHVVIPITTHQDSVGPMTRCVADAAAVLSVIAGRDPNDESTLTQPEAVPDYTQALDAGALSGARVGVPRAYFMSREAGAGGSDRPREVEDAFERALGVLRELGAVVVDEADLPSAWEFKGWEGERTVMKTDFKVEMNRYFEGLVENPSGVRSLKDLIKFNEENRALEMPEGYEDQSILIEAEATNGLDEAYFAALAKNREMGATRGIDAVMEKYKLDALVLPADGATSTPAALAGYPIVTVPLGFFSAAVAAKNERPGGLVYPAPGAPLGLAFFGPAFSEFKLLGYAYAYEQRTRTRWAKKAYEAAVPRTQLGDIMPLY